MGKIVDAFLADYRGLISAACLTFDEFIAGSIEYRTLMRRRRAEIRLPAEAQSFFNDYSDTLHFVVLATPDDPDTVAVLPVLACIADSGLRLDMRVARDDDDLTLLDAICAELNLIDELDELDLPLLLIFDEEWQLQEQWGPRPAGADRFLDDWMESHPEYERLSDSDDDAEQDAYLQLLDQLMYEMRVQYNSSLNAECVDEIQALLAGLRRDENGDDDLSELEDEPPP